NPYWLDTLVLLPGQTVTYRATALVSSVQTGPSNSKSMAYAALTPAAPWFPVIAGTSADSIAPYSSTESSAWEGSANASITALSGQQPKGWRTFSEGAGSLAGEGVVTQIDDALAPGMAGTGDFEVLAVFSTLQESGV